NAASPCSVSEQCEIDDPNRLLQAQIVRGHGPPRNKGSGPRLAQFRESSFSKELASRGVTAITPIHLRHGLSFRARSRRTARGVKAMNDKTNDKARFVAMSAVALIDLHGIDAAFVAAAKAAAKLRYGDAEGARIWR